MVPPPTSVLPPLNPISKDLLALDLAPSRPPSHTSSSSVKVTVSVQIQQQRLRAIDDEMKEVNQRISELQRKAIQDQMRYMQDVFSRQFVAGDPKGTVVQKEEDEESASEGAAAPERMLSKDTEVALHEHELVRDSLHKKQEEESETTDMIDSADDDEDQDEPQEQSKGSFKQTLLNFGRRPSSRKSPAIRTLKKAFVARMDQEIATMRDELRELEISGGMPSEDDYSSNNKVHHRSRSGSPSWRAMLRKKSPPRKKARNRSPVR